MAKKRKIPDKFQIWIDARERFHLSHTQIQMARELGMNPKKFGSLANHNQEPWKAPLPIFIQNCYFKQFKKNAPNRVLSIEDLIKLKTKKKEEKRQKKMARKKLKSMGENNDEQIRVDENPADKVKVSRDGESAMRFVLSGIK